MLKRVIIVSGMLVDLSMCHGVVWSRESKVALRLTNAMNRRWFSLYSDFFSHESQCRGLIYSVTAYESSLLRMTYGSNIRQCSVQQNPHENLAGIDMREIPL